MFYSQTKEAQKVVALLKKGSCLIQVYIETKLMYKNIIAWLIKQEYYSIMVTANSGLSLLYYFLSLQKVTRDKFINKVHFKVKERILY